MRIFVACWCILLIKCCLGYSVPKPSVELLTPRGFRISIPDNEDPGIKVLAFHGKVNTPFAGSEVGDIAGEGKPDNSGNWVYENNRIALTSGDILYYWIYIQHKQLGYRLDKQKYEVKISTASSITRTTSTTTQSPFTRFPTRPTTSQPIPLQSTETTKRRTTTERTYCTPSITKVKGKSVCQNELIFEDDFSQLDEKKWKHQVKIPLDSEDAEFVSYQDHSDVCFAQNGILNIGPKLLTDVPGFTEERLRSGELNLGSRCTETDVHSNETCRRSAYLFRILPPIVSCRLRTKESFSFKYGIVEIRAQLPKGDWIFPQLMLDPVDNFYGNHPYSSGQMRVAFIRSNEILTSKEFNAIGGNRLSGGAVLYSGEKLRDEWMKSTLKDQHLGNEYHTYTLTWTDQEIKVALDGIVYDTIHGGFRDSGIFNNITDASQWRLSDMSPFDREFYVTLGVGVGGVSDFPDGCRTGIQNLLKPWSNTSPKAELKFWNDKYHWYHTWSRTNAKLKIDYIKVWSI